MEFAAEWAKLPPAERKRLMAELRTALKAAAGPHPPFTGWHNHSHSAYGSGPVDDDGQHSHQHHHDGDSDHGSHQFVHDDLFGTTAAATGGPGQ
jgi:hypothetical protein